MTTTRSILSKSITINDTAQAFQDVSIPFYTANFHVVDFDVLYGDGAVVSATAKAGSVIELYNGDLKDIFFQNANAGDTATVKVVATVPSRYVTGELNK